MTLDQATPYAQQLAKSAVDGLLKQAGKQASQETSQAEVTLDPETQKKIIEREVRMAADPDFELAELAKQRAAERMRRSMDRPADVRELKQEPAQDKAKLNQEIGATAKAMLDMGIPPAVVASYLTGSTTPQVPIAFQGGGNQGLTLTDVLALVDRMNSSRANSEIESIIREMRDEIKAIKNTPPAARVDPVAAQTSQLEGLGNLITALEKLGVVQRPGTAAAVAAGEPIEVVREKNRHEEKLAEIEIDKNHKEQVGNLLAELPERIGAGVAGQLLSGGDKPPVAQTAQAETFNCPHKDEATGKVCGTVILVPQGAVKVECPTCHTMYGK